jgi:hypothetical protein
MMELPPTDRWRIAKDFTEEEKAYSRKMARKSLLDDRAAEIISDWDGGEVDEEDLILGQMDKLGESDDGSV